MAQVAYVDWDGLVYYDGKIKDYIQDNLEPSLKDGGRIKFTELVNPDYNHLNYLYTIEDAFTSTDIFEVYPKSYPAGTAVKVTEVSPAVYRYTIFNEFIPEDYREEFSGINSKLEDLENRLETLDPEATSYYTKEEVDGLFNTQTTINTQVTDELNRIDKRVDFLSDTSVIDHAAIDKLKLDKADRSYVDERFESFAPNDLTNYYTKEEIDNKLTSLDNYLTEEDIADKADSILFKDKKYEVKTSIGDFNKGDVISNISLEELFTRILKLSEYTEPQEPETPDEPDIPDTPDEPNSIIEEIKDKQIPVLSGNVKDSTLQGSYLETTFIGEAEYKEAPKEYFEGTSIFYEYKSLEGQVIEYGYQCYTPTTSRGAYLTIAIPTGTQIVSVLMWSSFGSGGWTEYIQTFTKVETIEQNGISYDLYKCSEKGNGYVLRFIIEEVN